MKLYIASPTQNLKVLKPENVKHALIPGVSQKGIFYASPSKAYAAGFCFKWNRLEGFRFFKNKDDTAWVMRVPPKYSQRLNNPCSIYEVDGKNFKLMNYSDKYPEYYSRFPVQVLNEDKYQTARECLANNGVEVSLLRRKPIIDNGLVKSFHDIIDTRKKSNTSNSISDRLKKIYNQEHYGNPIQTRPKPEPGITGEDPEDDVKKQIKKNEDEGNFGIYSNRNIEDEDDVTRDIGLKLNVTRDLGNKGTKKDLGSKKRSFKYVQKKIYMNKKERENDESG